MRSAVVLLLLAVCDADDCQEKDYECPMVTGACRHFWQSCAAGTTCSKTGDCVCPSTTCAVNGKCISTTTTTPAPDDNQCVQAYQDRCFEQEPYTLAAANCCSQCNQGGSNDVCSWSFEETDPKLQFGGDFKMETSDCVALCGKLKQQGNTRYDYCPDTEIRALAMNCPAGAQSLDANVPKDLCEKKIDVNVECSWTYTRGESASTCPTTKSSSSISGSFMYPYQDHEEAGHCEQACKALSDMDAEPADFCSAGSIHSLVSKCAAAQKSLEQAHAPDDWCDLSFTESTKAVAYSGDVCDDAFRNDCWKQGAFKKCCADCYEDTGYATCGWSFKGPSVFVGEECTKDGTQLTAEFKFKSRECFNACSALSSKIKEPQDLCAGSDLRSKEIDGCSEASNSVEQALKSAPWCSGAANTTKTLEDTSQLKALLLVSDNQCKAAYQKRCYEQTSFSECCAKCSDGHQDYKCHWNFHESTKDFSMADVFSGLNSRACNEVCKLLSNAGNKRNDYCPGSALYTAAQACPAALDSLHKQVPKGFCDNNDKAEVACDWYYSFEFRKAAGGPTIDLAGGNLTGKINAKFAYSPDDKSCKRACAALGYNNNLPSAYCAGSHVWQTVSQCDAAKTSLQQEWERQPALMKVWCDSDKSVQIRTSERVNFDIAAETKNPPVDPKCTGRSNLHLCDASFNQKCFNKSVGQSGPGRQAFHQCCNECFMVHVKNTCTWSIQSQNTPLNGKFDYYGRSIDCFDGCNSINTAKEVADLCPNQNKAVNNALAKCDFAWNKLMSATGDARGSVRVEFCESGVMQSSCKLTNSEMDKYCGSGWEKPNSLQMMETNDGIIGVRNGAWVAVAFTAIAAATFMVYKSRKTEDVDGYVRFGATNNC